MSLVRSSIAALVALASLVLLPVGAAQAYPEGQCSVNLSTSSVEGGKSFTATATSPEPTTLAITFLDDTRSKSNATTFTTTFRTPTVDEPTEVRVSVTCGDEVGGVNLTLLPAGGSDNGGTGNDGAGQADTNGILPNTGGAALWILILAVVLVAGGVAVVVRRRRA